MAELDNNKASEEKIGKNTLERDTQDSSYQDNRQDTQSSNSSYNHTVVCTSTAHTSQNNKDRAAAGVFAITLGCLGVHKFYLGYTSEGVVTLLVTLLGSLFTFGLAAVIMSTIGIIEGILYLTKSEEEFKNTYVLNKKTWF